MEKINLNDYLASNEYPRPWHCSGNGPRWPSDVHRLLYHGPQ